MSLFIRPYVPDLSIDIECLHCGHDLESSHDEENSIDGDHTIKVQTCRKCMERIFSDKKNKFCSWYLDDYLWYRTSCKKQISMPYGFKDIQEYVEENKFKYCPFCSWEIKHKETRKP